MAIWSKSNRLPNTSPQPRGRPLPWSAADLDKLSEVTPADIKAAEELWRRAVPWPLKGLLRAKEWREGE